ncbi:hypothetical protein BCR36DRAFT_374898 [Piromyces finnis]|uniref:G-protein coupled receptors family 3 profile domain-containing protein n=1 Tax=Piromyces finnis TaxID=1754191 RepID=A0A1Y1UV34_9FUNG|nr:hypothetical protein BCR36DRAFT_374898 [Piromyces finnis]|eukprot:ORX41902.1 hypothetical protein BCR36DRAFT_374898 [Piromyces finnis]
MNNIYINNKKFPYNNFPEINQLQQRSPISLLFAHLYYKHNETSENSLEAILDEFCDIIDDALFPDCDYTKEINFTLGECQEVNNKREIKYNNCKINSNVIGKYGTTVECEYITNNNYKGLAIYLFSIFVILIELIIFVITLIILLEYSVVFWIGPLKKHKCIIRIWLIIISMTGYICSYSIKAEIIVSIYSNRRLSMKSNIQNKSYLVYILLSIIQFFLLSLWTIKNKGIELHQLYLDNVGYYTVSSCSYGNLNILNIIFSIDYLLLFLSITISYRGRNIPGEFNDSRKIFIISIISAFQLTICYFLVMKTVDNTSLFTISILLIIIITLITNIIFIGSKILIIYNIGDSKAKHTIVVVGNKEEV